MRHSKDLTKDYSDKLVFPSFAGGNSDLRFRGALLHDSDEDDDENVGNVGPENNSCSEFSLDIGTSRGKVVGLCVFFGH